jgi:predicted RNase H-like HicB family nuclease
VVCRSRCVKIGNEASLHKDIKVIVEKHSDGYIAYPLGLKGVVVGEGDSYDAALADAKSAIDFHVESFGADVFDDQAVLEAFVAEAEVSF